LPAPRPLPLPLAFLLLARPRPMPLHLHLPLPFPSPSAGINRKFFYCNRAAAIKMCKTGGPYLFPPLYSEGNKPGTSRPRAASTCAASLRRGSPSSKRTRPASPQPTCKTVPLRTASPSPPSLSHLSHTIQPPPPRLHSTSIPSTPALYPSLLPPLLSSPPPSPSPARSSCPQDSIIHVSRHNIIKFNLTLAIGFMIDRKVISTTIHSAACSDRGSKAHFGRRSPFRRISS
jgi:hypothetical protein